MASSMTRSPMTPPPLSHEKFDRMPIGRPERLWGRPAIARVLGVSEDTVASWAKIAGVPIFEPLPGRYVAFRTELEQWIRTKQTG